MASDSDDELPPLESDSAVGYTAPPVTQQPQRSSLLRPEPSEGKKSPPPVQPARRPRDPQPQLWQAPDLTCRSTVRGVKRGKPKPREPATLVAKDRFACGYASAPDEPSHGKEQRRLALEAPSLPETPQDSNEECFSPKRLREPDELDKPQASDPRPRPRSSQARSIARALDRVLVPRPALDEATQLQREGVMAKRREDHLRRWPTRRQARLVDTVQELREHFSGAVRLEALRTRLREEMAVRDMGIGDMFALVDKDQSLSLDASELHDMARRLSCAARLQDAEQLVAERGADGELTIEAFVEWFHEGEDPLVAMQAQRRRDAKTPSAGARRQKKMYGAYGLAVEQKRSAKALDAYAAGAVDVDLDAATDGQLLQVDACLLDVDVRRCVEDFWRLADEDGSGVVEYEEYIELSLNLQKALHARNASAADLRNPQGFDEEQARETAERDWDQDRRVADAARRHRAAGVVDARRFELSLLQLADAWADARTSVAVKKVARDASAAGTRVGPACRRVAVATTLWNLLEAVSVLDDDGKRVWHWRFYRQPPTPEPREDAAESVHAPSPVRNENAYKAPRWVPKRKKAKKKHPKALSPTPKKSPPKREWSPIAGLYTPPAKPPKEVKEAVAPKQPTPKQLRVKTPKQPTPPPTPPDPHLKELELMASLKPRNNYKEREELDHCVYREAAQASPLQKLPRLKSTPTPPSVLVEAAMLAVADAETTGEAPAPAPPRVLAPVPRAPAPRGRASRGMVFNRDIRDAAPPIAYDGDAAFLALMRGVSGASPAPRRPEFSPAPRRRKRRPRDKVIDPGLDAILRETAASPQKKLPRGSFDADDALASFVSSTSRSVAPWARRRAPQL